jgi:hypothetical protein
VSYTRPCHHRERRSQAKEPSTLMAMTPLPCPGRFLSCTFLLSCTYLFSRTFCRWTPKVIKMLTLASFTQHNAFEVQLHVTYCYIVSHFLLHCCTQHSIVTCHTLLHCCTWHSIVTCYILLHCCTWHSIVTCYILLHCCTPPSILLLSGIYHLDEGILFSSVLGGRMFGGQGHEAFIRRFCRI